MAYFISFTVIILTVGLHVHTFLYNTSFCFNYICSMTFGQRLKYYRELKGLSQTDVAKALDIDKTQVSRYEGDKTKPSIKSTHTIAELLGISMELLLHGKNTAEDKELTKELLLAELEQLDTKEKKTILTILEGFKYKRDYLKNSNKK